jgi:hypothetical protein
LSNTETTSSFLFIPDISGFTDFVNDTEVRHSQHIISELLEIIIASNQLDLQVAEIEGDAILFYKEDIPAIDAIINQSKEMFIGFHHHLRKYEVLRICQCGACRSANKLSLKFIAHAGSYSFIDVGSFHKPYGDAVITAHWLLKNSISVTEYLLLTSDLTALKPLPTLIGEEPSFITDMDSYHQDSPVSYTYLPLGYLHNAVPPVEHFELPQKSKNPIRHSISIQRNIDDVYAFLIDFDFKKRWMKGIREVKYDKNQINQLGTQHTCIVKGTDMHFETIANNFGPKKWVYGEKLLQPRLVKEADYYFILVSLNGTETLVNFELHYQPWKGPLSVLSWIFRGMMKRYFINSISNLKAACEK